MELNSGSSYTQEVIRLQMRHSQFCVHFTLGCDHVTQFGVTNLKEKPSHKYPTKSLEIQLLGAWVANEGIQVFVNL